MVLVYHDSYHRKSRHISSRFRFSCTHFDDHLKWQSFRTASPGYVCIKYPAILNFIESSNQKVMGIRKSDPLLNKASLLLLCRSPGCAPLSTKTTCPI